MLLVLTSIFHQFLKELDRPAPERSARPVNRRTSHTRTVSTPNLLRVALLSERQPLLTRRRSFEDQSDIEDSQKNPRVAGGTILGIHNLAIVFPQFIVSPHSSIPYQESDNVPCASLKTALASSAIFKLVDAEAHNDPTNTGTFYGKNGVAWVLRFGGLCTLVRASFVPTSRRPTWLDRLELSSAVWFLQPAQSQR